MTRASPRTASFRHYGCHERSEEGELTHFNPMASLLQPITEAISFLFERGMPKLIPAPELALAFLLFSLLAGLCAGLCIPSGLVCPHILIGGCAGRLWGLALNEMDDFQGNVADPVRRGRRLVSSPTYTARCCLASVSGTSAAATARSVGRLRSSPAETPPLSGRRCCLRSSAPAP